MKKDQLKNYLGKVRLLPLFRLIRKSYIQTRTWFLRLIYPDGKYVSCNDAQIFVDFNNKNHLWYYGDSDFLGHEIAAFITLFSEKRPEVIVDIGAHWGIFPALLDAAIADLKYDIDRVICVEPDTSNLKNLQATLAKVKHFKVEVFPVAVSDKEELISIYKGGGGACAQTYKRDNSELVCKVRGLPLQVILKSLSIKEEHVTHIKLDVDGYEPAFFYGAKDFLSRHKPLLLIEFWANGIKEAGFDIKEYWGFLCSNYYMKEVVYPEGGYLVLSEDSLSYIESKTEKGITNLLLTPR